MISLWYFVIGNILERSRMFRDVSGFENGSRKMTRAENAQVGTHFTQNVVLSSMERSARWSGRPTFEDGWFGLDYRPIGPKIGFSRKCLVFGVRPGYFGCFYDVRSEFDCDTSRVGNNASRSILGLMGLKSVFRPKKWYLSWYLKLEFELIFEVRIWVDIWS